MGDMSNTHDKPRMVRKGIDPELDRLCKLIETAFGGIEEGLPDGVNLIQIANQLASGCAGWLIHLIYDQPLDNQSTLTQTQIAQDIARRFVAAFEYAAPIYNAAHQSKGTVQ
jgi:hypothetical protein